MFPPRITSAIAQSDQDRITNCLERAEYFSTKNKDSSLFYLQKCIDICSNPELTTNPEIFFNIGNLYHNNGIYTRALEYFMLAASRAEGMGDKNMYVHSKNWAGYIYSQLGETERAIETLMRNLEYTEREEISDYLAEVNLMLGFSYRDFGDNKNAMKYFEAAKNAAEKTGVTNHLSTILNEIGNLHSVAGNTNIGLEYQLKGLEMRKKENNLALIGYSYNDIANSYFLAKDHLKAIQYFKESLKIQNQLNNDWAAFYCYVNIASIFHELKKNALQKAYLDSAKTVADELRLKPVYQLYHESCLTYYESINDYRQVYSHFKLMNAYRDSMKTEETARQIAEITSKYNDEKRDRELERKNIENQRLKLLTMLSVSGVVFLIIVTLLLIRSFIIKKKVNTLLELKNQEIIEKNELLLRNSEEIMKQRDEIKYQRDEYQKLNATKDKFFSIIAHDLKNPFSGLIGLTDTLLTENKSFSEKELNEVYADLNETSKVTYSLLENLLLWSRAQTKSLHIVPEIIVTDKIIEEVISLYSKQAKAKNIEISAQTETGLKIYADINMVRTVIRNLVSNGIKFTNQRGRISIISKKAGKYAEISVNDTGVGLSQEDIDKLFRIDVNTIGIGRHHDKGSGLGLILCREFVEMNGGTIRVESTIGKGSSFIFTFPLPD
ncbi:MAG: ATP-binding protein [Bacteroidales bacterium]|jgi:signal transduction histidine kinase|nr:ATP-binding protein [Bacteroidales bacterium]